MNTLIQAKEKSPVSKWDMQITILGKFAPEEPWLPVVSFYDDEIGISCEELIGLTQAEITSLKVKRDAAYIRG